MASIAQQLPPSSTRSRPGKQHQNHQFDHCGPLKNAAKQLNSAVFQHPARRLCANKYELFIKWAICKNGRSARCCKSIGERFGSRFLSRAGSLLQENLDGLTGEVRQARSRQDRGSIVNAIKTAGAVILGIAAFICLLFLIAALINGTAFIADKLLPYLITASDVAFGLCIVILLPLSLFRFSRIVALWGFFIASYIFGLGVWMYGFLVTYEFWGGTGIFIGLLLGVVGVVPLEIIAAALHGIWYYVDELILGLAITYGARVFALFLMKTLEPRPDRRPPEVQIPTIISGSEGKRGISMKFVTAVWKTVAVILAIIVGIFASNTAGWNGGAALLGPTTSLEHLDFVNLAIGILGLFGCVALSYFVFRIAKWALWLLIPITLYFGLVIGVLDGIASDFDVTRREVIRHHYANAYALQHMSAHAFDLTCHDTQIALSEDAKVLCTSPK